MKNIWQTYRTPLIIFFGIFLIILVTYINTLIVADVSQADPLPAKLVSEESGDFEAQVDRQRIIRKDPPLEELEKEGEALIPSASSQGAADILILVN